MKKVLVSVTAVLLAVMSIFLIACVPSNAEKAKAKMEKAGYEVQVFTGSEIEEEGEGAKEALVAHKGSGESDFVYVIWFDKSSNAKDYYEKMLSEFEEDTDWVFERSGKVIYWGTTGAVEKFKK